jgi:hypothetical protein
MIPVAKLIIKQEVVKQKPMDCYLWVLSCWRGKIFLFE